MKKSASLSVILPCRNEEEAIPSFLPRVHAALEDARRNGLLNSYQVLVVDDASEDQSRRLLAELPWVETISLAARSGYGSALKTGFEAARGDLIAFLDADGTYDPADLLRMIPVLLRSPDVDLVLGDRLSRGDSRNTEGLSFVRRFGNSFYTWLTRALFRQPVRDVCSGYRVFRRSLAPAICALPHNQLNFSLAMTLWCLRKGTTVREIPIRYDLRSGKSKLSVTEDGVRFLLTILGVFLNGFRESDAILDSSNGRTGN